MEFLREKLMQYALKILGQRKYTVSGIRRKLVQKARILYHHVDVGDENGSQAGNHPTRDADIAFVLEKLVGWKYLDDEDFAKSYVRSRLRSSPRASSFLRLEMRMKGIKDADMNEALVQEDGAELTNALNATQRKIRALQRYPSQKQKEKLIYFLRSRGFHGGIIQEVLRKIFVKESLDGTAVEE